MKIYIPSLKGHCGIYSIAKSKEVLNKLLNEDKNVLYVEINSITLHPQNIHFDICEAEYKNINFFINFDVVDCQETGILYRLYSDESDDNAIVLTSKCNSNCIMCPCSENSRKFGCLYDLEYLKKWIHHVPGDVKFLTITGGEPTLLKSNFFNVLELLKNKFKNTEFLLLTNGRAFSNSKFIELFAEAMPDNLRVGIPIYANISEIHDYITQSNGSLIQATKGIQNLISLGCDVELRIVISKLNYLYLDNLAEYIVTNFKGLVSINFMGLEMLGNAAKNTEIVWIDYKTAFNRSKTAILKLIENGFDISLYNFPLCFVDKRFWPICKRSISDYKVHYSKKCSDCSVKSICGGIFESTLRFCDINVIPIG